MVIKKKYIVIFTIHLLFFTFNTLQAQNLLDNPSTNIKTVLQIMGNPLWELREVCLNDTCEQTSGYGGILTGGLTGKHTDDFNGEWGRYIPLIDPITYEEKSEWVSCPQNHFKIVTVQDSISKKEIYQVRFSGMFNINERGLQKEKIIMNLTLLHEKIMVFEGYTGQHSETTKKVRETYFLRKKNMPGDLIVID